MSVVRRIISSLHTQTKLGETTKQKRRPREQTLAIPHPTFAPPPNACTPKLFIYSPKKRLAAFRSGGGCGGGEQQRRRCAVFVPGLTDGLLALDYVPALAAAMDRLGFSFVQPILSSSYKGAQNATDRAEGHTAAGGLTFSANSVVRRSWQCAEWG